MLYTINRIYQSFSSFLEKWLVALTVAFFIGGVLLAKQNPAFGAGVSDGIGTFVDGYGYVAPVAIFLILSPSLAKMLKGEGGKFGSYAMRWMGWKRVVASVWAVIFTAFVFKFPLLPAGDISVMEAVMTAVKTVIKMSYTSPFLIAIWVAIAAAFISLKVGWLNKALDTFLVKFEAAGQYLLPFVPLAMLAVGAYIYNLPNSIGGEIAIEAAFRFQELNIFGLRIDPNTAGGMILAYVVAAFLVGIACMLWHLYLVEITRRKNKKFKLGIYWKKYWLRMYPMLWATSSETLSAPLNLYLTKTYFPHIQKLVRRFVVGMGSYLNINGTIICVFVLGGMVASMLGLEPSLLEWFLAIPIIWILGYSVPGLPGELVLFAGPVALLLNVPEALVPVFLALYIGLQVGLPDSFRTGTNSTDNAVAANYLEQVYEDRFEEEGERLHKEKDFACKRKKLKANHA